MKLNRVLGVVLATSFMAVSATSVAAAEPDRSAYSFQAGKAGRIAEATPYAGMNYEGGERGDTSSYGYLTGKEGRAEEVAPYAGANHEGGEQEDTSAYSFRTGRVGKPWDTAE